MTTTENKQQLRARIRKQRSLLPLQMRDESASSICQALISLPAYQRSQYIGLYYAQQGEVNTQLIIEHAHNSAKTVYLPVLQKANSLLIFYHYSDDACLLENEYGIMQPNPLTQASIAVEQLDLIILPLVCFDQRCHRMGRGAGYYDRTLEINQNSPTNAPTLIGLAYEFQKHPALLTPAPWDVPMDHIITESTIYSQERL